MNIACALEHDKLQVNLTKYALKLHKFQCQIQLDLIEKWGVKWSGKLIKTYILGGRRFKLKYLDDGLFLDPIHFI
jgi:hypothetical protein